MDNTIILSRHEQVCLMRLRFERLLPSSGPMMGDDGRSISDDGRSVSRNVASLNILVHDVIKLLYYEH